MNQEDEILEMFFDEQFVPQAYLDILLSSTEIPLNDMQSISWSLLSRLEYYTRYLTKELENTIKVLKKPAEILSYSKFQSEGNLGTTKLEYYLDTLANSVKSLESDIVKINSQLVELDTSYEHSAGIVDKLNKLKLTKSRLLTVQDVFQQLRTIMTISVEDKDIKLQKVTAEDFKVALDTLKETILVKLTEDSGSDQKSVSNNSELMAKIDSFISLKPLLKGFTNFYPVYLEFAKAVQSQKDQYLSQRLLDERFI
ncbi:Golgi transport complex subunit COG7 Ecym_6166 [Eremothecium cymbalariae DBVPG|uniref:Uncharacterized protein n=1 Tax=Eremothecium cymbalariae (strain CBS 270.75 / DBVPG 7215 / KCTC 17166 / NRRL Y-17582) TaxID=931890 RepID=G8JV72_ERECY|nr:hypothetical protein Ecym_6166 [Eremothecium cymbalariae DBVPG\